jgi:hypothetical protein
MTRRRKQASATARAAERKPEPFKMKRFTQAATSKIKPMVRSQDASASVS